MVSQSRASELSTLSGFLPAVRHLSLPVVCEATTGVLYILYATLFLSPLPFFLP